MQSIVEKLEYEWSRETGFFGQLRCGKFSDTSFRRFICILDEIKLCEKNNNSSYIEKEVVRLLWYCPMFIDWQKENLINSGVLQEKIIQSQSLIETYLEDIFGVP